MKDIIIVRPDRCKGCNACVRVCPAPEANVTMKMDNGHIYTKVNVDKCIACGECLKVCTQGARDYVDDTVVFMSKILIRFLTRKLNKTKSPSVSMSQDTR